MVRSSAGLLVMVLLALGCSSGGSDVVEAPMPESVETVPEVEPTPQPPPPETIAKPPPPAPARPAPPPPVKAPPKVAKPAPPPAPLMAHVTIQGDAKDVLLLPDSQGAQRSHGGDTLPGAYEVKAWFKQPVPVVAGNLTLAAGERAIVECSSATKRCEKRQAE